MTQRTGVVRLCPQQGRRCRHARNGAQVAALGMEAGLRAILALLILLVAYPAEARTITDSAGRKVEIPDRVEKVFAAGPPASILLYMLAPEKMTGWPDPPRREERPYIAAQYRDLPALGRLTGRGGTANLEVVLKAKPDLILDFGSVRDTYVSLADNVQEQTKIPVRADRRPLRGNTRGAAAARRYPGAESARRGARALRRGDVCQHRQRAADKPPERAPARLSRARARRARNGCSRLHQYRDHRARRRAQRGRGCGPARRSCARRSSR